MTEYYKYSRKHFEFKLRELLIQNRIGFMEDITKQWIAEGNETWEHIYKVTTRNKSVDIIIFSSVDMRTESVRDIGGDAVRVIYRWNTKNGYVYQKIAKHYRIKTLFDNLKDTLIKAQNGVFSLNYKEFSKAI